jgi:DNA invertase Pin-like site-specific DNA recombinase
MPKHTGKFVSYIRVSTAQQGRSGLGLGAQRRAVADFLNGGDWDLAGEFVEVESGSKNGRPKLAEALSLCRAHHATLVIAKLDRLSRNAAFLLQLRDAGVDIICADMPEANRLLVGIMAMIAEHEAEAISARTAAALDAIKREITETGSYTTRAGRTITSLGNGGRGHKFSADQRADGIANSRAARKELAQQRAVDILPIIQRIQENGITSASGIARQLTEEGVPTPRGRGAWQAVQVQRILARVTG